MADAALGKDLGHCGTIAKYIRQEEDLTIHTEFIHKEFLALQNLTHKAFTADQVAIGFYIHSAFRLPAAFFDKCFQLLVLFRCFFF